MGPHTALAAFFVLDLVARAAAHGGTLHQWPSTPSGSNYIRTKIASCGSWIPGDGQVAFSLVSSTAAADVGAPVFVGEAIVWNYLYGNCSVPDGSPPSAGVEFNVTATRNGKPLSNVTLDGVAMTGTCAAGGEPYYLNLTAVPLDDKHNILWFHNFTTNSTGRIWGNGANDGFVYTSGNHSAKSLVIRLTETNESLACCDLTIAGPANTDWAATLEGEGKECEGDDDDDASSSAMSGHDHSSDDSMTNMTTKNDNSTVNGTARATSAAGGAVLGWFVAAAGVLVSVLAMR
eukprot:GHUV01001486.1.p1 GENE.GHUV01001486.1~~GHUV01001486.1.p1  ORF type:complete len:290 (+),score=65.35 GHUV01001486.1:127-996(+)